MAFRTLGNRIPTPPYLPLSYFFLPAPAHEIKGPERSCGKIGGMRLLRLHRWSFCQLDAPGLIYTLYREYNFFISSQKTKSLLSYFRRNTLTRNSERSMQNPVQAREGAAPGIIGAQIYLGDPFWPQRTNAALGLPGERAKDFY